MADVFEVQDEIARKIAEALRITLSPQEQEALAAKPTENLQAYDLYLRGKSFARRVTRQDPSSRCRCSRTRWRSTRAFALAHAAIAYTCAQYHWHFERAPAWIERAQGREPAARARSARTRPRSRSPRPGSSTPRAQYDEAVSRGPPGDRAQAGHARAPTTCWAARCSPPAATRRSPTSPRPRSRPPARTTTSTCRSRTRSGALGKSESAAQRRAAADPGRWRRTSRRCPEDARGRTLLAADYVARRTARRTRCARRASPWPCAPTTRWCIYNVRLRLRHARAQGARRSDALQKAWKAGFKDPSLGAPRPRPRDPARRSRVRAALSRKRPRAPAPEPPASRGR